MAGKFVLKRANSGRYRFNLVASNGQVIATSFAFDNKQLALDGIKAMKSSVNGAQVEDQTGE
jgi:uncharacterized protein YegP (UPF0339 family)